MTTLSPYLADLSVNRERRTCNMTVSIPVEMKHDLAESAKIKGVNVSRLVAAILQDALKR